ncbi:hypothetical protein ABMA28_006615 [Loxostege sticticalis]|uniref:Ty3 transposon capsid-like protein domain-containing protein n=1 Tax=Loxostege sticticalis TaxID=481309 RepID=A0ABD0SLS7_LOXSC
MSINLSMDQLQQLITSVGSQRRQSFAASSLSYNGTRDSETLETFITAISVYKSVENIADEEALRSLPLVLKEDAAVWWNGVKGEIFTWADFENRIRHAFAPKRPPHLIYEDIFSAKQDTRELTENFIAKKRALFAQLPLPAHTESQQLDMIYGRLNLRIRQRIPRESVSTYDALLNAARSVEQLFAEKNLVQHNEVKPAKKRCIYCRLTGHTIEVCRRKAQADAASGSHSTSIAPVPVNTTVAATQAPSPSAPKFNCYGCGAPGVVRSKCTTCKNNYKPQVKKEELSFCAVNTKANVRRRPVIGIGIGPIAGTAYVDSCAKSSVASFELYQCLISLGYTFEEEQATVTLADGIRKEQKILTVAVPISLCNRIVPTTLIILPESRENRTLLGVDFLQDAGMILNIPQMTWCFVDEVETVYDLQPEDSAEISTALLETSACEVRNPSLISPMAVTPDNVDTPPATPTRPPTDFEPALPDTQINSSALTQASVTPLYRLIPIDLSSPAKRFRPLFDGFSPSFLDNIYDDALVNIDEAQVNLSPDTRKLFPSEDDDIGLNSISINSIDTPFFNQEQSCCLQQMLPENKQTFIKKDVSSRHRSSSGPGGGRPKKQAPTSAARGRGRPRKTSQDPCSCPVSSPGRLPDPEGETVTPPFKLRARHPKRFPRGRVHWSRALPRQQREAPSAAPTAYISRPPPY